MVYIFSIFDSKLHRLPLSVDLVPQPHLME